MDTQALLSGLRKCIDTYSLIQDGDRIAVGLSGGKDSLTLLYGLSQLRRFYPRSFSLIAIVIDPGFHMDYSPLSAFAESLDVKLIVEKTEIYQIVQAKQADH
ncbi:MAG: tRNA 2-thiocytidine(32) synthetase TtcA, partial [Verrucomicrobia bacterium]|nr:tRNA 2-thiocytidine(32) synthetase TtcA [Verrucomicrobiota bacterium]